MESLQAWIVEEGEYEDRGIVLVAASPQAAVAAIKARYGDPYQVEWDEPVERKDGSWRLHGRFAHVTGYSIQHDSTYDITSWEIAS